MPQIGTDYLTSAPFAPQGDTEAIWASIIIVNYNAKRFLQDAIDSVAAQIDIPYELILVDNASTDGSLEGLRTDHVSNFKLLALDENTGFARGNNIAAAQARGTWIALLNPDAKAAPDWLQQYQKATEAFPDTPMFGGATISTADPTKLDGAGDCYFFLGIPWRGGYTRPITELPDIGECFSPCGASALYRRDVFLEAGGFDERYFCYGEDVDIGFRLRLQGYRCIFWPDAKALHFGSGTTSVASPFAVHHGTRNRFWMFVKNVPPLAFWILILGHISISAALLVRGTMKGRGAATWSGMKAGILGIGPVWGDRRVVQKRRKVSSITILKAMSWNWGLVRNRKPDVRPVKGHTSVHNSVVIES